MSVTATSQKRELPEMLKLQRNLLVAIERLDAFATRQPMGNVIVQRAHYDALMRAYFDLKSFME